jgi:hypothetical protein
MQFSLIMFSAMLLATLQLVMAADVDVLQYALVLEHLEYAFYRDGMNLVKMDMNKEKDKKKKMRLEKQYANLLAVRDHEGEHVTVLQSVIQSLGVTPVRECVYDFGYKTGKDFIAIARVLENVGVSAYTGAAYKIVNAQLLTAAATIATIEARHASYLNTVNGVSPFPNAFDSPLDMNAVVGLAGGFIKSCPDAITIVPYPALTVTAPAVVKVGSKLTVTGSTGVVGHKNCVFYSGSASVNSTLSDTNECSVPDGVPVGDNFLFVMSSKSYSAFSSTGILGGPALVSVVA